MADHYTTGYSYLPTPAHIARIVRTTPEEKRAHTADATRDTDIPSPTQALGRYLQRTNYTDAERKELITLGNQIIDACNDAESP